MIFSKKNFLTIVSLITFPVTSFWLVYKLSPEIPQISTAISSQNITNVITSVISKPVEIVAQADINVDEKTIIKNTQGLSTKVLRLALKAYHNAYNDDEIDNNKLTIIDYSLPSSSKRMWVIDMDKKLVDIHTYVSHGVKSGDRLSTSFSNKKESHKSSIGVMKTGSIYHGKRGMSLHLHGLEDNINDNVYTRHVVIHGAKYVNDATAKNHGRIGRSFGCPAVDYKIVKPLIKKIANGSLIFAYYPEKSWLDSSEYLV